MFKISQGMEIERPAEVVWPYLAALEQVPLWEHGILDVRQVDPGPLFVGMPCRARRGDVTGHPVDPPPREAQVRRTERPRLSRRAPVT